MKLGDMHHAVVALDELFGEATAAEVALKLHWLDAERRPDVERAKTALIAAAEQGYAGSPR